MHDADDSMTIRLVKPNFNLHRKRARRFWPAHSTTILLDLLVEMINSGNPLRL